MPPRFGRFAPKKSKRKIRSSKPRRTALGIQPGAAQVRVQHRKGVFLALSPRTSGAAAAPITIRQPLEVCIACGHVCFHVEVRLEVRTSASQIVISPDAPRACYSPRTGPCCPS